MDLRVALKREAASTVQGFPFHSRPEDLFKEEFRIRVFAPPTEPNTTDAVAADQPAIAAQATRTGAPPGLD